MDRKGLIAIIDEILLPRGYKRKGNFWVKNGAELNKIVDIQKSQYSSMFHINCGFIFPKLELGLSKTHVHSRLKIKYSEGEEKLSTLLNFENDIPDEERTAILSELLRTELMGTMETINTEADMLEAIRAQKFYSIAAPVFQHFGPQLAGWMP